MSLNLIRPNRWPFLERIRVIYAYRLCDRHEREYWVLSTKIKANSKILRARWSLFSWDSRVSRNSIFGTNLGTYCSYQSFKGHWKRFESHLKPWKNIKKNSIFPLKGRSDLRSRWYKYQKEKYFEKNSIFYLIGRSDLRSSSPIWRSDNGLTPK